MQIQKLTKNVNGSADNGDSHQSQRKYSRFEVIDVHPLSYTTQKRREAVERVNTNEYIRSQIDFIAKQERWDLIRTPYLERGECMADVPFFENPNVILGSWMGLSVYEADFGWGKPFHFGPGGVCPYDRGVISPRHGDDDVDVFMHFQVAHIQDFIIMFWEDIGNASCRTIEANI
ncbi:hypothetical protein HN51_040332 [Arachis hypogaea]